MNKFLANHSENNFVTRQLVRFPSHADEANVLADIYEEDINIAIWRRTLSQDLKKAAQRLLRSNHIFRISTSISPNEVNNSLCKALGGTDEAQLISADVGEIVTMFCYLFDLKRAGLRLTTLDRAMCPKFHVDRVPCRLVMTYDGIATEWLPHGCVNREKLGVGSNGLTDEESGLYRNSSDIQRLNSGDVALLKGEEWLGNEGAGLVHRSPTVPNNENRLLLTLDFN